MLKAYLMKKGESIYYRDNPDRTISLSECVKKVYTDKNTRIRLNLEKIIDLRNISTHFITEDYELKYAPLFQSCVLNFINELKRFHNEDITDYITQNFLILSATYKPLSNEEIKIKYPPEIAEKLIRKGNEIDVLSEEYDSEKFSININQRLYITKKKADADFTIQIDKNSKNRANIIKELKDPSDTHKYSYMSLITAVQERLKKKKIYLNYSGEFNQYVLNLFIKFYDIKNNENYAYMHKIGNTVSYTYSEQCVEFIVDEIKKDPDNIVESLKNANKKR